MGSRQLPTYATTQTKLGLTMKDAITDFWTSPEGQSPTRYIVPVDEDGILTFPDELMDKLGWKEGDELEWIDNKDGSFTLRKLENTNGTV